MLLLQKSLVIFVSRLLLYFTHCQCVPAYEILSLLQYSGIWHHFPITVVSCHLTYFSHYSVLSSDILSLLQHLVNRDYFTITIVLTSVFLSPLPASCKLTLFPHFHGVLAYDIFPITRTVTFASDIISLLPVSYHTTFFLKYQCPVNWHS